MRAGIHVGPSRLSLKRMQSLVQHLVQASAAHLLPMRGGACRSQRLAMRRRAKSMAMPCGLNPSVGGLAGYSAPRRERAQSSQEAAGFHT